jgi:hypothetical protein
MQYRVAQTSRARFKKQSVLELAKRNLHWTFLLLKHFFLLLTQYSVGTMPVPRTALSPLFGEPSFRGILGKSRSGKHRSGNCRSTPVDTLQCGVEEDGER